jgi:hypothetical protein
MNFTGHQMLFWRSNGARWAGHVARTVEGRGAYAAVVGTLFRWQDNTKMDVEGRVWKGWIGFVWLRIRSGWLLCTR